MNTLKNTTSVSIKLRVQKTACYFLILEGRKAQENGKQSQVERIVQNLYCCCLPVSINNYGTNLSLLQAIINIRLNQRDTDKGAPLCVINENGPFLRS